MSSYQIWQPYIHPDLIGAAEYWLSTINDAGWDWGAGSSHINGTKYPCAVYFKHTEDYLAFRLKFRELLKF